jgi:hypothetical protein
MEKSFHTGLRTNSTSGEGKLAYREWTQDAPGVNMSQRVETRLSFFVTASRVAKIEIDW